MSQPTRIPLPQVTVPLPQTQSQRKEAFVLIGVTTESILRSRIAELEAQVENLKAQLREAHPGLIVSKELRDSLRVDGGLDAIGTSNFPQIPDNGVSISQAQWDKMYPKGAPFHVTLKGKPE